MRGWGRWPVSGSTSRPAMGNWMPALFTSTVTVPRRSSAWRNMSSTCRGSPTSAGTARATAPRALRAAATACARWGWRSLTATRAPSAASRRQMASPMPEPPPVTRATRPAKRPGQGVGGWGGGGVTAGPSPALPAAGCARGCSRPRGIPAAPARTAG